MFMKYIREILYMGLSLKLLYVRTIAILSVKPFPKVVHPRQLNGSSRFLLPNDSYFNCRQTVKLICM